MKKHILTALLIGAVAMLSTLFVTSCNKQTEELNTRVTVLEGMVKDLEQQIKAAVVTGSTITSATQDKEGVWTIVLSNGQTITINPSKGGGSTVTVEETAEAIIITVDGRSYVIPKGGAGVQLVYSPEFVDGIVELGNDGATVRFLTNTDVNLEKTTFDVAEAHELLTRAGGTELFTVKDPKIEDGMLVITLKGLGCKAGKTYTASIVANIGTSKAISNYFTVAVSEDYHDDSEQIGDFVINAQYNPSEIDEKGFCTATIPGDKLVSGLNLNTIFDELPAGARIELAKQAAQPGGKAQEKYDILAEALSADGTFKWTRAPRTDFNENEQHGFLIKVFAGDITKAKIYLQIDNPLANGDIDWFPGFKGQFEAEWHSRTEALGMGEQTINLAYQFNLNNERVYMGDGDSDSVNPEHDINLIFGGKEFFTAYTELVVSMPGDPEKVILENNGEKVVPGDYGKMFLAPDNEGFNWFNRALNVDYQECPEVLVWDDEEHTTFTDRGAIGIDWWWGDPNGNPLNINNERNALVLHYGLFMDQDGVFHTGEKYCGFAMRLGIGAYFDYAYGTKCLKPDQFGLLFINRRRQPEGFRNPVKGQFGL